MWVELSQERRLLMKPCPECGWQMNESSDECIDCGWAEFNWGSLTESANKLIQLKTGANK
jgi:uncharacterized membrane protein YvbJ